MKNFPPVTTISVLLVVISSSNAQAATFTEIGDAGETLTTAQDIQSGSRPLESISGTLAGDADVFQISLTGDRTFSAKTVGGASFDTQLFLFDSAGKGVYGNDDAGSFKQSTLPKGRFSPAESGNYYLAVSGFDYDPVSDGGEIFSDFPDVSFNKVVKPTASGGESSVSGFDGARLDSGGSYTIALTGAEPVPEPSSVLGTLALGAWGLGYLLKKNKKNKQT
jgi:hypothetical protein